MRGNFCSIIRKAVTAFPLRNFILNCFYIMCIFHVVNLKARLWVQNLFGTRMLKHQLIHKIVRFCMIIEPKERKHVLNRMTQFTMVLSRDFQLVTLVSSFIVGACAVRTCLVDEPNKIYVCEYKYLRSRNRSFKTKFFVK